MDCIKGRGSLSRLVQLSTSIHFSLVPRLLSPHAIITRGFALGRVKGHTWRVEGIISCMTFDPQKPWPSFSFGWVNGNRGIIACARRARKTRSLGTRLGFCAREASSFWGHGEKFPHNCLLLCTAIYN